MHVYLLLHEAYSIASAALLFPKMLAHVLSQIIAAVGDGKREELELCIHVVYMVLLLTLRCPHIPIPLHQMVRWLYD